MTLTRIFGTLRPATLALAIAIVPTDAQQLVAPNLTIAQVLDQMQRHDQRQKKELKHYIAVRHYLAEYRGYAKVISAKMDVEVTYNASSGKSFRILSQSGSTILCDKVLKRAVDSEKEAAQDTSANALTTANYKFRLLSKENLNGRLAYIIEVVPLRESKFLYQGKIWVDAADFAVVKIEAEPSKNPSFWITRTLILFNSAKTGDFWLPQRNHSETKVRIGGTAFLTIDYGIYQLVPETLHGPASN